jgi:hypothetical protein
MIAFEFHPPVPSNNNHYSLLHPDG